MKRLPFSLLFLGLPLFAQTDRGSITGTVTGLPTSHRFAYCIARALQLVHAAF